MTNNNWQDQFRSISIEIYGIPQGLSVSNVLLPAFLKDFRSMLSKAKEHNMVHEEYCSEDKRLLVKLTGEKNTIGGKTTLILRSINVNGTELLLSDFIGNSRGWKL